MRAQHIVGICLWLAIGSAAASAQQPQVTQHESTRLARDLNGRWQVVERNVVRRSESNGEEHVVVEMYGPNYVAPSEPMRMIRRIETTVRQVGPNRWLTERQIYEPDGNGRLALVFKEKEETEGTPK